MKKTTFIPLVLLLLSGITSCNTSPSVFKTMEANDGSITLKACGGDTLTICKFDAVQDTIDVPLSEFIEDCQIIRMDNSEQAYFNAWFITVTDNHIGVRQQGAPFKLFNKEGKFLYDVGAIGNGPGEYALSLYDEVIDEQGEHIFFTPFYGKKILMYGLDGKWIKDIELPGQINKAKIRMNPDETFSILNMPFNESDPFAFQLDMEGNVLKKYPTAPYMAANSFDGEIFARQNSGEFDFFYTSVDTIFHYDVTTNRLLPRFTMEFPGLDDKPIHIYTELPHHFITHYYYWKNNQFIPGGTILVDKKKQASSHFRLVNDYFGNLPIDNPNSAFNKGWFIENLEPGNLREKIESHLASGKCPDKDKNKLKELAASLHENDNNLLFIGKLKR